MPRFIMISGRTVYSDQSSQLLVRRARMAHPRVFRHHHAHQIVRLGIDHVVSLYKICIFKNIVLFYLSFSEAIVQPVLFHQFDVLQERTVHQRGCPPHHALTLVISGIATEFVFYKGVRVCMSSYTV